MDLILRNLSQTQADDLRAQLGSAPAPTPTPTPTPTPPPPGVKVIDVPWSAPGRYLTADYGGFEPTDVIAVRFTPGNVPIAHATAKFSGAEYASSPVQRQWTISATPNDFTTTGKARLAYNLGGTTSITAWFAVGATEGVVDSYYPQLQMGKTYYLNIRNKDPASLTAGSNMFIDFAKPAGT